jgi:DNA-directed RNA polymerase subunit RPC12/RpoP
MSEFISLDCPTCGKPNKIFEYQYRYKCEHCDCEIIPQPKSELEKKILEFIYNRLREEINTLKEKEEQIRWKLKIGDRGIRFYSRKKYWTQAGAIYVVLYSAVCFYSILST